MSVFLTAFFMLLLSPFGSSFLFPPPPEAFTQICNKNLKSKRHPSFLSLTERKVSNQLIVISTFFSKHRLIWWFLFELWKKEGRGYNLVILRAWRKLTCRALPRLTEHTTALGAWWLGAWGPMKCGWAEEGRTWVQSSRATARWIHLQQQDTAWPEHCWNKGCLLQI